MVSTEVTQTGKSAHPRPGDDSVRITAQQRRAILRKHYEDEYATQSAVVAFEKNDLKVLRSAGQPYAMAELRAAASAAVLQHICMNLLAFGGNRDFGAVSA